jgi:DNA-binding response OmpR family regulator
MPKEKILVVDDEAEIRDLITKYLEKENMTIAHADSGEKALNLFENNDYDLIILDIMMDGIDGLEVLKRIRQKNKFVHVIILSAREEDYDKILGLGLGADDYITKPFIPQELIARVKAHLRRHSLTKINNKESNDELLTAGDFELDIKSYSIKKNNILLDLSAKEIKLMLFFMKNPERVFTKKQIYENVWEDNYFDDNSLMVYIRHLREKIEDNPNDPQYLTTVWGIGYKFSPKGQIK